VQVSDPDTLTPMQREFIRLAQIFKSRLVAEREIQQRVMERSMIEDRFDDYVTVQRAAKKSEDEAKQAAKDAERQLEVCRSETLIQVTNMDALLSKIKTMSNQATTVNIKATKEAHAIMLQSSKKHAV
jgi:hypothetical protein